MEYSLVVTSETILTTKITKVISGFKNKADAWGVANTTYKTLKCYVVPSEDNMRTKAIAALRGETLFENA